MKKNSYALLAFLITINYFSIAQNVGINSTGANPNPSALLDIDASPNNNTGFLMPRLTTAQRLAIANPAEGLEVYDKNLHDYYYFNGTKWDNARMGAGTVNYFANAVAPVGYLECNGQSVSATTYPELFNAIGYTYGGAGASFNVPDLRGEFIRGWDNARGIDISRTIASSQTDDFKTHLHTIDPPNTVTDAQGAHTHTQGANSAGVFYSDPLPAEHPSGFQTGAQFNDAGASGVSRGGFITSVNGSHQHNLDVGAFNSSSTGGTENRPRNIALMPCIKY